MEYPALFCERMNALLGEEAPLFWKAMESEPSRALRFDPQKVGENELREALGEGYLGEIPFGECACRFLFDHIGSHPLHHGGALYVQEPAAMAPVFALEKKPCGAILDLCAAPGGKSLQAASYLLSPDGVLFSNEPVSARLRVLMQNVERLSEKRSVVTSFDAAFLPRELEHRFDLVICDVPCSGEGMMRKNEDAVCGWSEEKVRSLAPLQRNILESASRAVKAGGVVLYSTCTWSLEENEGVVADFLSHHSEFSLCEAADGVKRVSRPGATDGMEKARRFYPHVFSGEGQFLAILKKEGETELALGPKKKEKKQREEKRPPEYEAIQSFLRECLEEIPEGRLLLKEDAAYLVPKGADPLPEGTVSPGVMIGQVRKGRVIPHHRFFMAYYKNFRRTVRLTPLEAEAYLRGEELSCQGENGWAVALLGSCPLGGVKIAQGRAKNHYPKGLRKGEKCTTN